MHDERCRKCGIALLGEIEMDTGVCGPCGEAMYERDQERREWDHYHPPEDDAGLG
jgi:predicted RNA-binding Zn-ribbon protein involved in translation (DUF1610 family)